MTIKSRAKTGRTEQLNIRVSPELKQAILKISKRDAPENRKNKPIGEIIAEGILLYEVANTLEPLYDAYEDKNVTKPFAINLPLALTLRLYDKIHKKCRIEFFNFLRRTDDPVAKRQLM